MRFMPLIEDNRHDSGNDGDVDARQFAAVAKIEKIAVVEEKLGHDVVRAGVDLLLEVIHFQEPIRGGGMAFGKSRDADAKPARVRMSARIR